MSYLMKTLARISLSVLIALFLSVGTSTGQNATEQFLDKGLEYADKGQHDEAISEFSKAIALNPRFADAYNHRGASYAQKRQHDKAISDYNKAIEINPNHALAYRNRGYVYKKVFGDEKRGCSDFKRACELGDCDAYEFLRKRGDCE